MRLTIRINPELTQRRIIDFITTYVLFYGLNLFIKIVLNGSAMWNYVSKSILGVLMVMMVLSLPNSGKMQLIIIELITLIVFAFSFFNGDYTSSFFTILFNICLVYLPLAIGIKNLKDFRPLIDRLYIISWPLQVILVFTLMSVGRSYLMSAGYALTFQALVIIDHLFIKMRWYDIIAIVVDLFFIVVFGSRGPLICIICYILLRFLGSNDVSTVKRILRIPLAIFATIIVFRNTGIIISLINNITRSFGFYSRTLAMFLSGSITSDSGRRILISYFLGKIRERPFWGWGVTGGWIDNKNYPHNLIIEIICSFGYILGIPILIFLFYAITKGFLSKDTSKRRFIHILFAYNTSLLMSSSFLLSPLFFMYIAACLNSAAASETIYVSKKVAIVPSH